MTSGKGEGARVWSNPAEIDMAGTCAKAEFSCCCAAKNHNIHPFVHFSVKVRQIVRRLCDTGFPVVSTAQHSTAQHSTAQHSTAQHSTAQHSTDLDVDLLSHSSELMPVLVGQHTPQGHLLHLAVGCLVSLHRRGPVGPELCQGTSLRSTSCRCCARPAVVTEHHSGGGMDGNTLAAVRI